MSSTYARYQGPSSLPADYGILSRLTNESSTESQPTNTVTRRRESFPASHYHKCLNPTIGIYPRVDSHSETSRHLIHPPTETSPLLNTPPMPDNVSVDNPSAVTMMWEELTVLTRYAIPVFGYVSQFIFHQSGPIETIFTALISLSTLSS